MTEKRFVYYEHKGADYILDTPNESLDFIEMLGDCLEAEEIVDLLNEQHEQIERLKGNFRALEEVKCELAEENEQLKQQKDKWKQQCIHFKGMLDDMDIAYLCDEWIYGELKGDVE